MKSIARKRKKFAISCDRTREHGQPSPSFRDLPRDGHPVDSVEIPNQSYPVTLNNLGARYERAYHSFRTKQKVA